MWKKVVACFGVVLRSVFACSLTALERAIVTTTARQRPDLYRGRAVTTFDSIAALITSDRYRHEVEPLLEVPAFGFGANLLFASELSVLFWRRARRMCGALLLLPTLAVARSLDPTPRIEVVPPHPIAGQQFEIRALGLIYQSPTVLRPDGCQAGRFIEVDVDSRTEDWGQVFHCRI
jgi:hypothetical protein